MTSKSSNYKYDPKKDRLNINYDDYKKSKLQESTIDYENKYDFKFMFYYIPEEITHSILGVKLSLIVKFISIIYAYRALRSLHDQIENFTIMKNNMNLINLAFNTLCIFTSILLYFSMYKKSYSFMKLCYYVYVAHFFYKLIETFVYIFDKLSRKKYHINAVIGIILGLSTSSVLNLCSTWIIFSYMVYLYNITKDKSTLENHNH